MKFNLKKIKLNKQYTVIGVICFVAIVIIGYLYYMVSDIDTEILGKKSKIDRTNRQLKSLYRKKPSPNRRNITAVDNDAKILKTEIFSFREVFGNPYINSLASMVEYLFPDQKGDTEQKQNSKVNKLMDFLNTWRAYYVKNSKNNSNSIELLIAFLKSKNFDESRISSAQNVFYDNISRGSTIQMDNIIKEAFLKHSIGMPLAISRIQCRSCIVDTETNIADLLKKNQMVPSSYEFTAFTEFETMPNDDQIPYIYHYLWLYDDLFNRLVSSDIKTFKELKKINGLTGEKEENLLVLKMSLDVESTFSSVRNLINSLQEAYKKNSIYVLDFVEFHQVIDEVDKLPPPDKKKKPVIEILIGNSDRVRAVIKFSYYIYNQPIVKLK